jgi:HEAT repeat protein
MVLWTLVVVGVEVLRPGESSAAEQGPPAVEEWQIRGILAALKDGYPAVRALAAQELANLLDPNLTKERPRREWRGNARSLANGAKADLHELLKDQDSYTRMRAADALVWLHEGAKDVQALREFLKDQDPAVRGRAAEALVRLYQDARDVPVLRELLKDRDPDVRRGAAEALVRLNDREAVPALRELLKDWDRWVRLHAAEALAWLGDKEAVPTLRELLDRDDILTHWRAVQALVRVYWAAKDVPALRGLLKDRDADVRWTAAQALVRVYWAAKDVPALREFLKERDPDVRSIAAEALVLLGDKEAVPVLRELLKDQDSRVRTPAAEALVRLYEAAKDVPALREFLKDGVRLRAAEALVRLNDKEAVPVLRELLKDPDSSVRRPAAEALVRLYEGAKDVPVLRGLLKDRDPDVRGGAAEALVRLIVKEAVPVLRELLKDPDSRVRTRAAEALVRLDAAEPVTALKIPYEDTFQLYWARWLAQYWGGKDPKQSVILCRYLGRPAEDPPLPASAADAHEVVEALEAAWDRSRELSSNSGTKWLQEDIAKWWSSVITSPQMKGIWAQDDLALLKRIQDRLNASDNTIGRGYLAGIQLVIDPFELKPSPFVRTLMAFAAVNLIAVFLYLLAPVSGGIGRWLPFVVSAVGGLGVTVADLRTFTDQVFKTNAPLLFGLMLAEVVVLIGSGALSPRMLRCLAQIEPIRRVAVPIGLRLPWSRRRFFRDYVLGVRHRLDLSRERALVEKYLALPATARTNELAEHWTADPASDVLAQLAADVERPGAVLVAAPGGRGKSALIREVVARALAKFEQHPASWPLPVLLSESGKSVEDVVRKVLGPELASSDLLTHHLEAGDFFLVFDGVTESGPAASAVDEFARTIGRRTPILLGARPSAAYEDVTRSAGRWMTVEPLALADVAPPSGGISTFKQFVENYGGTGANLPDEVKNACRGPGGQYVPLLVRLAVAVENPSAQIKTMADVFFKYFMQLIDPQFPASDAEREAKKLDRLHKAARWCVETYWRDGDRQPLSDGKELQQALRQAGVLLPDLREKHAQKVWFFHDLMQSYLTAYGLWRLIQRLDSEPPAMRPEDGWMRWTEKHVLLRATAGLKFAEAKADLVIREASELFQMCVVVFEADLRPLFGLELERWAGQHYRRITEEQIEQASPEDIRPGLNPDHTRTQMLRQAAELCERADTADGGRRLIALYANVARLVYPFEQTKSE